MAKPLLKLRAVTAQQTLEIDLSESFIATAGEGMDPYNPSFTNKVFSHSLLKEGGTLALESLALKELVFPVRLGNTIQSAANSAPEVAKQVEHLNEILTSPGAVCEWQDEGLSQPTVFDLASGQFDIEYSFRENQAFKLKGLLRLFVQPLGRRASPRTYATASGVGPLLMISPYTGSGTLAINASTQAGAAGFGGKPQASGGVFYWGNPSLAGDAPAQLQISYVGPLAAKASTTGLVPAAAVSVLPDQNYQPLLPVGISNIEEGVSYWENATGAKGEVGFTRQFAIASQVPAPWAGSHRLFAIARASTTTGSAYFVVPPQPLTGGARTSVLVNPGKIWGLYDLGTFSLRGSQPPGVKMEIVEVAVGGPSAGVALDVLTYAMLPDGRTWFLGPEAIQASSYGNPSPIGVGNAPWTNTILLDDVLGDQYLYGGASVANAPSPAVMAASSARITQYTRGLVPRPDPKEGLPIIAILGVPGGHAPSVSYTSAFGTTLTNAGASWPNAPKQVTLAQVNILERCRYVLP